MGPRFRVFLAPAMRQRLHFLFLQPESKRRTRITVLQGRGRPALVSSRQLHDDVIDLQDGVGSHCGAKALAPIHLGSRYRSTGKDVSAWTKTARRRAREDAIFSRARNRASRSDSALPDY